MTTQATASDRPASAPIASLGAVASLFLRLGTTAFGGPAAHIALMQEEVVSRRAWLTSQEFLDLVGATNLIPGPNSTELAIHIGHRVAGWRGLLVAGICFILPASMIVGVIAWAYVRYGTLPAAQGILYGVKPVVLIVVGQALWKLARTCLSTRRLTILALADVALILLGLDELIVLFGTGVIAIVLSGVVPRRPPHGAFLLGAPLAAPAAVAAATPFGLWPLFLFFVKVGSVLFGSGYVLIAFLRSGMVERNGWLTEQQLLDAIAVGQVTPGPVFTTATFIGYLLAGSAGAAVATIGIFVPAFLFVAISAPFVPRLRQSPTVGAFLDGVNVASLALMAVVSVQLVPAALVDPVSSILAAASAILLFRYRVSSTWLIFGAAVAGVIAWSVS